MRLRRACVLLAAAAVSLAGTAVVESPSASATTSKAPVVIAYMDPETGVYASPWRHNDIELAIKQINARGGVDGHKFEYVPYDTNITPQASVTATQQALSAGSKPTAFLGYLVDDQIDANAQALRASGIPVLGVAEGPAATAATAHVPNLWTVVPDVIMALEAATKYMVKTYHPKTVGVVYTNDIADNAQSKFTQTELKKLGVKHVVVESISDTATDATAQALAMRKVNAIIEGGFPVQVALFNTALSQNGIHVPVMGNQLGLSLPAEGLNTPAELDKFSFTPYCYAKVLPGKAAASYSAAYAAAYPGTNPADTTPYNYDAVNLLAAAIKADGGNLSPGAINRELGKITYHGVCGTYHADSGHDMMHTVEIDSFAAGVNPGAYKGSFTEPPLNKAQYKIA